MPDKTRYEWAGTNDKNLWIERLWIEHYPDEHRIDTNATLEQIVLHLWELLERIEDQRLEALEEY